MRVKGGLHWDPKERPMGTSLEGLGAPSVGGSEGPAQQRREEAGGGAVVAGQQAQAGPGSTRGGLQGRGGEATRTG